MILDPEKRFSGSSWRFHRHNWAPDAGYPNVICFDIKPSIDYSPKSAAGRP